MNRLFTRAAKALGWIHRHPTDAQYAGDACALCGDHFANPDHRVSFGWIGLPFRRRAYACEYACTLDTIDDVEELWRAAIPARQDLWNWHLGVDDMQCVTGPDGFDMTDEEYQAAIAGQPHMPVKIVHAGGVLTTRPLPQEYAERIAAQAQRLGFTAMIDKEVESPSAEPAATDTTPEAIVKPRNEAGR
jgi:hypothetical protein